MNGLITVKDNNPILEPSVAVRIADFERQIKAIQEAEANLKSSLLAEMESKNIKKVETEELIITYVEATEREDFDKKKFRAENPDTYDEYVKFTPVRASIRLKVK